MKVIFLQDVPNVARAGDVKEVRDGYARNYLFPRGLAVLATPQELQRLTSIQRAAQRQREREEREMKALGERLEGLSLTLQAKAGPTGRLYGAVTSATIAQELSRMVNMEIDKRAVELEEPIRQLGEYQVRLRLHPEVNPVIQVKVEGG